VTGPWEVVEIANERGMRARLANYGARLLELWTPDRRGELDDVVLGFATLEAYRSRPSLYLGCTIGRVANRIRDARFTLDGVTYRLTPNDPPNHLHGGRDASFDNRFWSVEADAHAVTFRLLTEHLEEGYPGSVRVAVTYTLTDADELVIDYLAEPDRRTPISLTHHSYWNLGGHRSLRPVLDHELWVGASRFTPLDERLVPTGEVARVADTPLDFREPTVIGARIGALTNEPTRGYDHNLVLDASAASPDEPDLAARLHDALSGRVMELWTTEPALQVYSGQMLRDEPGKHGAGYMPFAGLALEAQRFPNAVNEPAFPSVIVEPGTPYRQRSIYRFLAE
jgi:aldose 1-epimerase